MKELGVLYVDVDCSNCGKHDEGKPEGENSQRCGKCGRFAETATDYCGKHDVDYEGTFPEDNHCVYCREERAQQAQRQHMATRDRRVEPW